MIAKLNPFRRSKMSTPSGTTEKPLATAQFTFFGELPDPCQFLVVSFLATAPFENIHSEFDNESFTDSRGTLVGTFPLVSKKFRDFCQLEVLWQACLERALSNDVVFSEALSRMAPNLEIDSATTTAAESETGGRDLIPALLKRTNVSSCRNLYQVILNEHIRVRSPVFFMPMNIERSDNASYELHFFEPRYRLMMAELVQGSDHGPGENGPVFLHAVDMRGPHAKAAALVRVMACQFAADGRCLAELKVIGRVRLRRCWVRPQSYSLYYADGYRCDSVPLTEHRRQSPQFFAFS